MNFKFYLVAAGMGLLTPISSFAGNFNIRTTDVLQNVYLENKGQIVDQNGLPRPDVKYIFNGEGFKLYLRENGFSYEWFTESSTTGNLSEAGETVPAPCNDDDENDESYAYLSDRTDVNFQHANRAIIMAGEQQPFYVNYFTNYTGPAGITRIRGYDRVTYSNLYPGVDLVFSFVKDANGKTFPKYEFICHHGSRLSDISMQCEGLKNISLANDGSLMIWSDLGFVNETRPFLLDEEGNKLKIVSFHVNGNEISFSNQRSGIQKTEIIDPTLKWGTYIGGTNKEVPDEIAVDKFQNIIISARVHSTTGIATAGAYKTTYAGGDDIGLIKFSNDGAIIWGTYYGGKENDVGFAVTVDTLHGNIFVGGRTSSTSGIATQGAVIDTFSGRYFDVVLAMFSPEGFLKWGTYMGGPGKDDVQGLCTDQYGNVIASGYTESLVGIATPGAYSTKGDPIGRVFLMKFDSTGHQLYGTYYGGNGRDRGHGIAVDAQGCMYEDGSTQSKANFATPGAFQTTFGGSTDAFVIKWSPLGRPIWCTYYGGTGDDRGRDLRLDRAYNFYFIGQTESKTNMATTGAYKTQLTPGPIERDGFLAKFDSSGHRLWGTYYGGNDIEMPRALQVNGTGAPIYIGGYTKSDSGLATPGAYNVVLGGHNDAFFNIFNYDGSRLLYETYYGGAQSESANSGGWYGETLDVDSSGNIFLNGPTNSRDSIATAGSFKDTLSFDSALGSQFDIFLAKFGDVCVDAFEPNDSLSHCPQLLFNPQTNKLRISALLGYPGDKDYYRFDVSQSLDSVEILLANLTLNADLSILDSNGKVLDSAGNKMIAGKKIVMANPSTGTYYAFIKSDTLTQSDQNNCYTLAINEYPKKIVTESSPVYTYDFSMYPNPAHDKISIHARWHAEPYFIDLCDVMGKVLNTYVKNNPDDEFTIPLRQVVKGIYFVRLHSASGQLVKPLVVE